MGRPSSLLQRFLRDAVKAPITAQEQLVANDRGRCGEGVVRTGLEQITPSLELRVFSLDSDEPTEIYSSQVRTHTVAHQWLNENSLIYLQGRADARFLRAGNELWKLDLADDEPLRITPGGD